MQRSIVRLGEHDISSTSDGVTRDIKVIQSTPHPNYNYRDGTNDIALLYLERDVDISCEFLNVNIRCKFL